MQIKSLTKIDFNTIFKAFNQVFAAFDSNEIVSFTLNGIGNFNGIPTAYDTGTLKEYRGKGLATQIFEYSIPYLKEMNIQQYLLEVLQHNTKAVSDFWDFHPSWQNSFESIERAAENFVGLGVFIEKKLVGYLK
jgi:GNAT superfamily N-acetyltransferase